MDKIPTAAEELAKRIISFGDAHPDMPDMTDEAIKRNVYKAMINFASLHVKAALEEASNKATIELGVDWDSGGEPYTSHEINKESILNSYPETNII